MQFRFVVTGALKDRREMEKLAARDLLAMELTYIAKRGHYYQEYLNRMTVHTFFEMRDMIRISSDNVAAFVTRYNLDDWKINITGSRVYVVDLNIPWHSHMVTISSEIVTCLEWSRCGTYLLVSDTTGMIDIWSRKDKLANRWTRISSVDLNGEHVIAGAFFCLGSKVTMKNEKKDAVLYTEKFSTVKFSPTVTGSGTVPTIGCLVITSTGMLAAIAITVRDTTSDMIFATDYISRSRSTVFSADVAYTTNGSLLVAVACDPSKYPLKCFKIGIEKDECTKKLRIKTKQYYGCMFDESIEGELDLSSLRVTHLKFCTEDSPDALVVVLQKYPHSYVQVWELMDSKYDDEVRGWMMRRTVQCQVVTSVAVSKCPLSDLPMPPIHIALVCADNTVNLLSRDLVLQGMCDLSEHICDDPERAPRFAPFGTVDITYLGYGMVVLDAFGNLYYFQLHVVPELKGPLTVAYAVHTLEYCLLSGFDAWDFIMCMKQSMLLSVCDKFTERFEKQDEATRELYLHQLLHLKSALYRMLSSGSCRWSWSNYMILIALHSVQASLVAALRPSELSVPDRVPYSTLSNVLLEPIIDVDTVLLNLEPKEFAVERSVLLTLQPLIQFVSDVALNILAKVPECRKYAAGYNIITDVSVLKMVRQMLVVIRIWGLVCEACLPVIYRDVVNFDGVSTFFRLITRLLLCLSQGGGEIDQTLIDECFLLQYTVQIPPINSIPRELCILSSPIFYQQRLPIMLRYGIEPEHLEFEVNTYHPRSHELTEMVDITRHVFIGQYPSKYKECCRCQCKALYIEHIKCNARVILEDRWAPTCICGGFWRLVTSVQPMYSRRLYSGIAKNIIYKF